MALFISRHLRISSARPLFVSISPNVGDADIVIGHADHSGSASGRHSRLGTSRRCVRRLARSVKRCVLDSDASINGSDAATSTNCTWTPAPEDQLEWRRDGQCPHDGTIETDTVFAWVGNTGDTFDADDILAYGTAQIQWTAPIGKLVVDDLSRRFGTQVQVPARLHRTTICSA